MVFWICKSIIICIPVSRINYLFHFLSGTKCLNHLFSQSSGRSFLYEPKTVDNSHSEQTLVLLTAVPLLWMMMEDVKILLFTFFTLHWTVNTLPYNCYMYCNTSDTFFLDTLFKKIGSLTWHYTCGVSSLPPKNIQFHSKSKHHLRRISNIFVAIYIPFRGKKQREKTAWVLFVVTITVFFR